MSFNMLTREKLDALIAGAPEELRYKGRIVAFDVETPNRFADRLCSIGLTVIEKERVTESMEYLVDPECDFEPLCINIHGITPDDVKGSPLFPEIWSVIEPLFYDGLVIAHNAGFDLSVLKHLFLHYGIDAEPVRYADTLQISRRVYGKLMPNHKLGTLCRELGIELDAHHAGSDSFGCAELYLRMLAREGDLSSFEKTYSFGVR